MLLKKIIVTSLATLAISSSLVKADSDAEFIENVLTVPRVISAGALFENVQVQFDFNDNTFTLLNAEPRARFSSAIINMDEVLTDHIAQRSWVNGSHGCHINVNAADTATDDIVTHWNLQVFQIGAHPTAWKCRK